jgi:murein DD-endopeptidase MepM/ murein hydrolase activator NlpD
MTQNHPFTIVILKVVSLCTLLLACAPAHQESIPLSSPAPISTIIVSAAVEIFATPSPTSTGTQETNPTKVPFPTDTVTSDYTEICSPLESIPISDLPDYVNNPFNPPRISIDDHHMGVDFAVQEFGMAVSGRPVHSVLHGRVVLILDDRFPYGNAVIIETPINALSEKILAVITLPTPSPTIEPHPALNCPPNTNSQIFDSNQRSLYVLYAHLDGQPIVQLDDFMDCGEEIGLAGESGNALNPHLHLEVRAGPSGARLDSMSHYSTSASPEEMNAYCTWRVRERFQLLDPLQLFTNPASGINLP